MAQHLPSKIYACSNGYKNLWAQNAVNMLLYCSLQHPGSCEMIPISFTINNNNFVLTVERTISHWNKSLSTM